MQLQLNWKFFHIKKKEKAFAIFEKSEKSEKSSAKMVHIT